MGAKEYLRVGKKSSFVAKIYADIYSQPTQFEIEMNFTIMADCLLNGNVFIWTENNFNSAPVSAALKNRNLDEIGNDWRQYDDREFEQSMLVGETKKYDILISVKTVFDLDLQKWPKKYHS